MITLIADPTKKQVGCVLLQAMAACPSLLLYDLGFDSQTWAVSPETTQRRITGTREEWKRFAAICNVAHAK